MQAGFGLELDDYLPGNQQISSEATFHMNAIVDDRYRFFLDDFESSLSQLMSQTNSIC